MLTGESMATKTIVELEVQSNLAAQAGLSKQIKDNLQAAGASRVAMPVMAAQQGVAASQPRMAAQSASEASNLSRGVGGVTGAAGRDFAKQAEGLGGLVRVYATFAANLFAVSAAFTALKNAADTTNMIKGLDQLGASSGRSLGALSKRIVELTDGAISLREAMTTTAQATAAGMSSKNLERLAVGAKNASQALGVSMPDAVSRLSRGITKLEPELLDELGIFVRVDKASADYALTLGKTASSLTDFEKRGAFASAVLTQLEQKFGAIDTGANPFSKLAASLANLAQSGLEVVNKVLGPLVGFLAASPTALAAVLGSIGIILLKQALPAIGQFKASLQTAAEDSAAFAKVKAADAIKARELLNSTIEAAVERSADAQIAKVDAAEKKIEALQKSSTNKRSAMYKLLSKDLDDVTDKDLKRAESSAKSLQSKGMTDQAAAYRAGIEAIKDAKREEEALFALKAKNRDNLEKETNSWSILGITQKNSIDAQRAATSKAIVSNAAYNGSIIGITGAFKLMNEEIKANNITGFSRTIVQARGGMAAFAGATSTVLGAMGGLLNIVGIAAGVFSILDAIFSDNTKEVAKFESSLNSLQESSKTTFATLEKYSTLDISKALPLESLKATTTALGELGASINSVVKALAAADKTASGWDKFIDGFKTIIGKDLKSKASKDIAFGLSAAIAAAEPGPALEEARKKFAEILGTKDVSFEGLQNALNSIDNSIYVTKLQEVEKAQSALSNSQAVATAKVVELQVAFDASSKAFDVLAASLSNTTPASAFATTLLQQTQKVTLALQEPEKAFENLIDILRDPKKLSLLSPSTVQELLDAKSGLEKINTELLAAKQNLAATKARVAESKTTNQFELQEYTLIIKNAEDKVKKLQEASKEATKGFLTNIQTDSFKIAASVLGAEITASVAQGAITIKKAWAGVLTGESAAREQGRLAEKEISSRITLIQATYNLIRTNYLNQIATKENTAQLVLFNAASTSEEIIAAQSVVEKAKVERKIITSPTSELTALKLGSQGGINQEVATDIMPQARALSGFQKTLNDLNAEYKNNRIKTLIEVSKEETKADQQKLDRTIKLNNSELTRLDIIREITGFTSLEVLANKQALEAKIEALNFDKEDLDIKNRSALVNKALTSKDLSKEDRPEYIIEQNKLIADAKDLADRREQASLTRIAIVSKQTYEVTIDNIKRATEEETNNNAILFQKKSLVLELAEAQLNAASQLGTINEKSKIQAEFEVQTAKARLDYEDKLTAKRSEQESKFAQFEAQRTQIATTPLGKDQTEDTRLAALDAINMLEQQYISAQGTINAGLKLSYDQRLKILGITKDTNVELSKQAEITKLVTDIGSNLATVFGNLGTALGNSVKALVDSAESLKKIDAQYATDKASAAGDPKKLADAEMKYGKEKTKAEISSLASVAGASKKLFAEKTAAYKLLAKVEKAASLVSLALQIKDLAISTGIYTAKVTTAAASETAIVGAKVAAAPAKVAADAPGILSSFSNMGPVGYAVGAALVAMLLSMAGGGSGGSKMDMTGLTSADRQETQGTGMQYVKGQKVATGGGVFGDEAAKSTSIVDSLEIMKNNSIEGLSYDNKMLKALEKMADSIVGAAKSIYSVPGLRAGTNFGTTAGTTSSGGFGSSIPVVGKLFSSIFGGGTSASASITSAGIQFKGSFADITNDVTGSILQYKDVLTQFHEDGGWFGSDSDWSTLQRQTQTLKAEVQKSLSDIFRDAESLFITIGTKTGQSAQTIQDILKTIDVSMPVDIMGLTGQALIDELNAVIGTKLSDAANTIFAGFDKFKNFGEDYLATVLRVIDANDKVDQALRSIGSSFQVISNFDISEAMVKAAGSLSDFMDQAAFFADNFLSASEKLAPIQTSVNAELTRLNINSNITKDQFKALVLAQDLSTEAGRNLYQSLMDLAPGFSIVMSAVEQATADAAALESKIYELLGNASKVLAISREKELAAMDAALRPRQKYINALTDEIALKAKLKTAYDATNTSLTNSIKTLTDYKNALTAGAASTLTPAEKYAQAKSLLMQTAAQAQATISAESTTAEIAKRDAALAKLTSVSDTFLATSRELFASGSQYSQDFGTISSILDTTTGILSDQKTDVEKQLTFLDSITIATQTTAQLLEQYLTAQVNTAVARDAAIASGSVAATSVQAFATGGLAKGVSIVGEKGPELVDFQTPGRVYSNAASNDLFNTKELVAEIKALRSEVSKLREEQQIQTGHLITSTYDANAKNAETITTATQDAAITEAWKTRSQVKIA